MSGRGVPFQTLWDWRPPAAVIGLVRNLLFRNQDWCWGIVTGKVMGNQVCALGPQLGEAPLLFLAGGENETSLRKGEVTSAPPRYKMTQRHIRQNRSGKASLRPCQLKVRRRRSVSVSSVWQWGWRVWRWGRGGAKGKTAVKQFCIWFEVSESQPSLCPVLLPSPNLIRVHPKLTSQTDPALSLTIKSTLRPNETTLYQEQPLSIWSKYDPLTA